MAPAKRVGSQDSDGVATAGSVKPVIPVACRRGLCVSWDVTGLGQPGAGAAPQLSPPDFTPSPLCTGALLQLLASSWIKVLNSCEFSTLDLVWVIGRFCFFHWMLMDEGGTLKDGGIFRGILRPGLFYLSVLSSGKLKGRVN